MPEEVDSNTSVTQKLPSQPALSVTTEAVRAELGVAPTNDDKTVISKRSSAAPLPLPDPLRPVDISRSLVGQRLGHFQLEEFVGGGGMGAVFRATDTMLGRTVAVKVVSRQDADEEMLRRFRNEAQSAARLDHPHIARVYYVGDDRGWNYIVFEFIEGVNVRELVVHKGPLSVAEAISYTWQVAEALDHASQRDVVHRDIKPSNILVMPDGRAKLVDMGLARLHQVDAPSQDLTATGVTLGTFDYISPEQARDPRSADVRSDLYSLGCTLYFMLTAMPPFPEGTVLQKLISHNSDPPPDPRELRADLDDELCAITLRLMAKQPIQRFQSPAELIDALYVLSERLGLPHERRASVLTVAPELSGMSRLVYHLPWVVPLSLLFLVVFGAEWFVPNSGASRHSLARDIPTSTASSSRSTANAAEQTTTKKDSRSTNDKPPALASKASESGRNGKTPDAVVPAPPAETLGPAERGNPRPTSSEPSQVDSNVNASTSKTGSGNSSVTKSNVVESSTERPPATENPRESATTSTGTVAPGVVAPGVVAPGAVAPGTAAPSPGTPSSGTAAPATGNGATGNGATGNGATGNGAAGNGATGNGAAGNGVAGTGNSGAAVESPTRENPPRDTTAREATATTSAPPKSNSPPAVAATTPSSEATGASAPVRNDVVVPARNPRLLVVSPDEVPSDDPSICGSLEAAFERVSTTPEVDTIELRFPSRLERPLTLAARDENSELTIKAATGYAPLLQFRPSAGGVLADRSMLRLVGGKVNFVGVHFRVELTQLLGDEWSLFHLRQVKSVSFRDCTFTVVNDVGAQVAIFNVEGPPRSRMMADGMPPIGMRQQRPTIELATCIARGQANLVRSTEGLPFRLHWAQGFMATSLPAVYLRGLRETGGAEVIDVVLRRVTVSLQSQLCLVDVENNAPLVPKLTIDTNECVFDIHDENLSLVEHRGVDNLDVLMRNLYTQTGGRNRYSPMFQILWRVRTRDAEEREMEWGANGDWYKEQLSEKYTPWRDTLRNQNKPVHQLLPSDFRLVTEEASMAGFDESQLPAPPDAAPDKDATINGANSNVD